MADITMCNDNDCKLKNNCYRSNAAPNEYRQAYFLESPRNGDSCSEYWHYLDWQPQKRDKAISQNGNSGEHYGKV